MQNRAGLAHFYHEGRLSTRQIVASSYAREEPVYGAERGTRRRHERSHLSQHHAQADLPQNGGLARHVRPCDESHSLGVGEPSTVRDERLTSHHPFNNRMAALLEDQVVSIIDLGPHVAAGNRTLRKSGPDVEPSEHAACCLNPSHPLGDQSPQCPEQLGLASPHPLLRSEHSRLIILELWGDIPFRSSQCLTPLVIGRYPV